MLSLKLVMFFKSTVFLSVVGDRMAEGGILPMSLILISFLLMIFLIFKASVKLRSDYFSFKKYVSLVNQIALLALVIGLFTQLIGLIQVFDAFESLDNVNAASFAGGIKVALLAPLFGWLVFLIGRIATFILTWIYKDNEAEARVA
ncbi:MotA/TolQ/ExbB proton channel family protein [Gillisia sp. Hel1_33_143]|uniref:MotA/TolQ/ExbB proton channel family protein n=1 Tax=Gillisia sp. Hel1_33_143 TaxID=1336796 RepID=UPI00087A88DC|nr:MotA/TolQ/ExbB proton channel family protein [Gillisia sp. Hel1_33_143]SDS40799.1 MotA/TolQ/ExbB proton channel family protein [Gillisia sp. Hel1_33_143]